MIKHFCDACGKEITRDNRPRHDLRGEPSRCMSGTGRTSVPSSEMLIFRIETGRGQGWGNGEFCKYCIIDAVNRYDDRPRAG